MSNTNEIENIKIREQEQMIQNIDYLDLKKMIFMYNALNDGWTISKQKDKYTFSKKHEGKKEIFLDSYLKQFIEKNFDLNRMLNDNK